MPVKYYTEKEYEDLEEQSSVMRGTVTRLTKVFRIRIGNTDANSNGRHEYIPFDLRDFLREMSIVKQHFRKKLKDGVMFYTGAEFQRAEYMDDLSFLDAGCGIGVTLIVAEQFGFKVKGLELCEKVYNVGIKIWPTTYGENLIKQDILTYKYYNRHNIIYYYVPMTDSKLERKFEQKVEDEMMVGAVLIANDKSDRGIWKDDRFKRLDNNYLIWEKVKNRRSKKCKK